MARRCRLQRAVPHASIAIVALALTVAWPALAQSDHMQAAVRAAQARHAVEHGDVHEALRLYQASIDLDPAAHVLREYAQLLERESRPRDSAAMWLRFATLATDTAARDAAVAHSESLRRLPSLLRVRVLPQLAARVARVWFDHDPPRSVPVGGAEASVDGGPHRVRVEAEGFVSYETTTTTGFGESVDIVVHLEPRTETTRDR